MKKYLALVICGMSLTGNVAAQMSAEQKARSDRSADIAIRSNTLLNEAESRAMALCSTTRLIVPLPVNNFSKQTEETMDGSVSIEWSGGCVEGKRDGPGVLTWQSEKPINVSGTKITLTRTAEGRFVKGERLGMWCVTKFEVTTDGKPSTSQGPLSGLGCSLMAGHTKYLTHQYIKQPDGSWQEYLMGRPGASSLAAGALEAQSARILADAAAGKTDHEARVVMQSGDLDDLVPGSKIAIALSAAPIPLKDKRVAIVLSSQMGNELERFKRERQALIDASAELRGEAAAERAKFIETSNPGRLLAAVLKVVQIHAKDAQLVDDLADLKVGGFDYALVLDWKSMTRFDQLGKYSKEAWPPKPFPAVSGVACEALRGFLINRDLKVVKQLPAFPRCQADYSSVTGDQAYMWNLATFFALGWRSDPNNLGISVSGLNAFLKY